MSDYIKWGIVLFGIVVFAFVALTAAFFALGLWLTLANLPEWRVIIAGQADALMNVVRAGAVGLAVSTAVFCVARGVPVIIEGLRFFRGDLKTI